MSIALWIGIALAIGGGIAAVFLALRDERKGPRD
jgi:hypothetical protein